MGEESGVPVGLLLLFLLQCSEEKENGQRGRGCLHSMLFTSTRSRGGEKEELQDVGIYRLLSQNLTFEHENQ